MYGRIAVHWQRDQGHMHLHVDIPGNTTATVFLPTDDMHSITENGQPLATAPGVKVVSTQPGEVALDVGSGSYHFISPRTGRAN
jgi:alpha-L-rhamnosidase